MNPPLPQSDTSKKHKGSLFLALLQILQKLQPTLRLGGTLFSVGCQAVSWIHAKRKMPRQHLLPIVGYLWHAFDETFIK